MRHVFVYGTLLPGEVRWPFLEPFVVDEGRIDNVAGVLYDTGEGYPAASFDRAVGGNFSITGCVFELRAEESERALAELDEVEEAVAGLYNRVTVTTAGGVDAWAYEYGRGLELMAIEGGSWIDRPGIVAD